MAERNASVQHTLILISFIRTHATTKNYLKLVLRVNKRGY